MAINNGLIQRPEAENIQELKSLAQNIAELKDKMKDDGRSMRRPLVIEFCGSPKSGKTSCINSLNIFLKRNSLKTKILTERASVCPIRGKHDPIFNVWTSTSSINELNATLDANRAFRGGEGEVDVIISDRGVFDALCWFRWLFNHNHMRKDEYDILVNFALFERWRKRIDLVYIFTASADESLRREHSNLLVLNDEVGSIMNTDVLDSYKVALMETKNEFEHKFKNILSIDTTEMQQNEVGYQVTKGVLIALQGILNEQIGYFQKSEVALSIGLSEDVSILQKIGSVLSFRARNEVDANTEFIEPIPIAVIANPSRDKVFCIKKTKVSTSKNSPERDKELFYAGGHIRDEDKIIA